MILGKYSIGIGDRFARQGKAQLEALIRAKADGVDVCPVWNKSHREHTITGTDQASVRNEADSAVEGLGWTGPYFVDADHISLANVDGFLEASDFFTLDVADFIDDPPTDDDLCVFVRKYSRYAGGLTVPGLNGELSVSEADIETIARKYLLAVKEAGKIYRHIEAARGVGNFITEVSMDETDEPQTPIELFFILAAVADEGIPARTIAPKFSGRFNKGVDYVGDPSAFAREFEDDVAVVALAAEEFGLPQDLKLSVHSGSDKFSIYDDIGGIIRKYNSGLHLKTAGTTWLEEVIGLALAGGEGLEIAHDIYEEAFDRITELCGPYATVVDIDDSRLPSPSTVRTWSGEQYADALRHDTNCPDYNVNLRQLLHVAYKVAAEMGDRYLSALGVYEDVVGANVTKNIYERHIKPIFFGG